MSEKTNFQKPAHIYEIDLIRAITVFSVVALHALSYTKPLITGKTALEWYTLLGHYFHFNREMFMFVTGLVLTYVYFNREFSAKKFWLKRVSVIFIPYALWSTIYVVLNHHGLTVLEYAQRSIHDILTGQASFQLYYILLSLQFYMLFPLLRIFLKKTQRHTLIVLAISLVVQLLYIYFDFHYLQTMSHPTGLAKTYLKYHDRYFFTYQFFFLFGAFTAMNMDRVYRYFKKYGRFIPAIFLTSLLLYSVYYFWQVKSLHASLYYISSVLQPSAVLYSISAIVFFGWVSSVWVGKRRGFGLAKLISNTSFGIYFVHVLILSMINDFLLPLIPSAVPVFIKILTVIFVAFSASTIFCYFLLSVPALSWTIGKVSGRVRGK